MKKIWNWLKSKAAYMRTFEPATLRGIWVAVVALAGTLGLTVSDRLDTQVSAIIAALVVIVPLLQGLWTRQAVVPVATHDAAVAEALWTMPPAVAGDGALAAGDAVAGAILGAAPAGEHEAAEAPGEPPAPGVVQDDEDDA